MKPIPLFHTPSAGYFYQQILFLRQSNKALEDEFLQNGNFPLHRWRNIIVYEHVPSMFHPAIPMPFSKFPLPRHREENRQLHGRSLQPSFKSQGIQGAGGVWLQLYLEEGGGT